MAWLEGLVKGFNDRRIEVATQNEERAKRQNELEQKVFSTLLGSEDEELRAMGFNELLRSAGGPKKKGGLRGWIGEYQDSGAMDRVRSLVNKPVTMTGLPSRQLQPQFQIGTLPGAPTTPAKEGAAAQPSESAVEGGAPPEFAPPPTAAANQQQPVFPAPPTVTRPAGATSGGSATGSAFGALTAGPEIGNRVPRKVFLSPQEKEEREVQLEGQKETAKRRSEFEFLTGAYGPEEGKDLYGRHYLGSQPREQWASGGMFAVTEPDGAGGVTVRRIMAVRGPKGEYLDAMTHQPLPPGAEPVLPGAGGGIKTFVHPISGDVTRVDLNTGESYVVAKGAQPAKPSTAAPSRTTMVGPDGVSRVYQFDPASGRWNPIGRAPGAAPENVDATSAQQALKVIEDSIRGEFGDPGAAQNRTKQDAIQARREALAQTFGYDGFAVLQQRAAGARRGDLPDDPQLPAGVRTYVAGLVKKYPGNIAAAQDELVRAQPDLVRDHPNLNFDRVRRLLDSTFTAEAAKVRRGAGRGGPPPPPQTGTATAGIPKRLTRAQLRSAAQQLGVTEAQAEAEFTRQGGTIIEQ